VAGYGLAADAEVVGDQAVGDVCDERALAVVLGVEKHATKRL
jgi:hypothetical protein